MPPLSANHCVMLPSPTRLAEAISALEHAASCRSCGRSPCSSSRKTVGAGICKKKDRIADLIQKDSQHYDGALLVSPSCGHFFCKDCWAQAAADASTQSAKNDQSGVQCPVCQCPTSGPKPILSSLGLNTASASVLRGNLYQGKNATITKRRSSKMTSTSLSVMNERVGQLGALGALLARLRQLRGASTQIVANESAAEEVIGGNSRRDSEKNAHCDGVSEHETEIPGTCLPPLEAMNESVRTRLSPHKRNFDMDEEYHQHTAETAASKGSSHQRTATRNGEESTETPTVHENQVSHFTPSSSIKIRRGGIKIDASSLGIAEVAEINDAEDTGTGLSPLRKKMSERACDLNNLETPLSSELIASLEKEDRFQTGVKNEETTAALKMSPIKSKSKSGKMERCSANDLNEAMETNDTEIPGTFLLPPPEKNDVRAYRFSNFDESASSPMQQSASEVPGTNLPPLFTNAPAFVAQVPGQLDGVSTLGCQKTDNDVLGGPRRVSTSPDKVRRKEEAFQPERSTKRPRDNDPSGQKSKEAISFIRSWNIQSDPMMSQLTCDMNTSKPPDDTRRDAISSMRSQKITLGAQTSAIPGRGGKNKLYIAYDVLDILETRALNALRAQGSCQVVLDGIHSVPKGPGHGESAVPFPAILVTHAIDGPGLGNQKRSIIATCHRTYSYLKAKALGALIVDARWLVDSENAGIVLDCEEYKISSDLESHHNRLTAEKCIGDETTSFRCMPVQDSCQLYKKFDGVTFGLLRGLECNSPVEPLINVLGGRVITDANLVGIIDVLLVDNCMTLDQITKSLKKSLKESSSDVSRWSIDNWSKKELDNFISDGILTIHCGEGKYARIPIIRTKWLEDSICLNYLESFESYCWGILCL